MPRELISKLAIYIILGGTIGATLVLVAAVHHGLGTFSTIMACFAGFCLGGLFGCLGWFAE